MTCLTMLLLMAAGCGTREASTLQLRTARLHGTDKVAHVVLDDSARFTVLEFFSADCDGQAALDGRLRALYDSYHARGIAFFVVDSEVNATLSRDEREVRRRRYPFPILLDPGAKLAETVGAEYVTYTVILDPQGRIRYRGSIDSDDMQARNDATPYVRDALDDLLAGTGPRRSEGKTLGCALRVW